MNYPMKKRGWIRIVEAFVAILIVAGILLIIIGNRDMQKIDSSPAVHDFEISILREVQLNESLRENVLSVSPLPAEWNDAQFPKSVKDNIKNKIPSYLECEAKICSPGDSCFLTEQQQGNLYAESVIISSDEDTFNPRMLKLFCWEK